MNKVKTIGQFIIEEERKGGSSGKLSKILRGISFASKIVNREVNKAGLVDIIGLEGSINVQGEEVQKLDVFADEQFLSALEGTGQCAVYASEENEDIIMLNEDADYIVYADPLDGSSNIDVNVSIGTIFSIYKKTGKISGEKDCLLSGTEQVAAGYIIYGSSCMLVYTTGDGVDGFTLDPSIGEFCLSHPKMRIPKKGKIYSINEGNYLKFSHGVKRYIKYCQKKEGDRPYTSRYIGSFVADFHRNLIKGGIFMYPTTQENKSGKLRLMYECNPMAFIVEQAGGKALVAKSEFVNQKETRILEVKSNEIHQRVPIMIGSGDMVDTAWEFLMTHDCKIL